MSKALKNTISVAETLAPAARTATANGAWIDRQDAEAVVLAFQIGAWTDGTHAFSIEESDDAVTGSAVAAADLDGTAPNVTDATADGTVTLVAYTGISRYVRAVVTVGGAPVTGLTSAVSAIRQMLRNVGPTL